MLSQLTGLEATEGAHCGCDWGLWGHTSRDAVCADLMNTLWEADVVVFKAHITTGPGGKVLDMFWIYDNRCELPENHRCGAAPPSPRGTLQPWLSCFLPAC